MTLNEMALILHDFTNFGSFLGALRKSSWQSHKYGHLQLLHLVVNVCRGIARRPRTQARRQVVRTWGHHDFLRGHLIMFLPVCELSHFISFLPLLPHPTNVQPVAIFHNLEKLWRGHKSRLGGARYPGAPLWRRACPRYKFLADS